MGGSRHTKTTSRRQHQENHTLAIRAHTSREVLKRSQKLERKLSLKKYKVENAKKYSSFVYDEALKELAKREAKYEDEIRQISEQLTAAATDRLLITLELEVVANAVVDAQAEMDRAIKEAQAESTR